MKRTDQYLYLANGRLHRSLFGAINEKGEVKIVKEKKLHAPVRRGQKVGTVRYRLNGETIHSTDLIASESIQKRDLGWCFEILMKKICF
mgnify:CR=1 FL=1